MKYEILEQKKNPLFGRDEIKLIVTAEKNPSFVESLKLVSEFAKKPEENISLRNIKGKFGRKTFLISAYVYDKAEEKKKFLPEKKSKKAGPAKADEQKKEEVKEAGSLKTGEVKQ